MYRYFIKVSCASCDRERTTFGMSDDFVELRIVKIAEKVATYRVTNRERDSQQVV